MNIILHCLFTVLLLSTFVFRSAEEPNAAPENISLTRNTSVTSSASETPSANAMDNTPTQSVDAAQSPIMSGTTQAPVDVSPPATAATSKQIISPIRIHGEREDD